MAIQADFETSKGVKVINTFDGLKYITVIPKLDSHRLRKAFCYSATCNRANVSGRQRREACMRTRRGGIRDESELTDQVRLMRTLVTCMQGRDVIAQSQSGTGKTAMLSIAALQVRQTELKNAHVWNV
eukprot:755671-Hanusia_phi.AAC.5